MDRLGRVAHGVDVGIRGLHAPVGTDAPRGTDLQTRVARHLDLGADSRAQKHEVRGQRASVVELHGVFRECRDLRTEAELQPLVFETLLKMVRHVGVHERQDVWIPLNQGDMQAPVHKGLGHLQSDESASDDHDPFHLARSQRRHDAVHVGNVAQRENVRQLHPRDLRHKRPRTLAKDQFVVTLLALHSVGAADHDRLAGPVNGKHLVADMGVDRGATLEALRRHHHQLRPVLDLPRDEIREAAVCKGDVGAAFKHMDLRGLVDTPCLRRCRSTARDASDNKNTLGFVCGVHRDSGAVQQEAAGFVLEAEPPRTKGRRPWRGESSRRADPSTPPAPNPHPTPARSQSGPAS